MAVSNPFCYPFTQVKHNSTLIAQTPLLLNVTDLTFGKRDTNIDADDVAARVMIFAQSVGGLVFEIVDRHFKFSHFATGLGDVRSE